MAQATPTTTWLEWLGDRLSRVVERIGSASTPTKVALGVSTGIVVGSVGIYASSKRVRRIILFWRTAIPAFVAYKRNEKKVKSGYYKTKEEEQASWNKLHDKWAPKAYDLIVKLEGIYLKVAQIHGSRADMAPVQYTKLFSKLVDQVPSKPWTVMGPHLSKCLNVDLEDVFDFVQENPIAAASIGQVHRARLVKGSPHSGSRDVVVKVCYPNSEALVGSDLASMEMFSRLSQPEMVSFYKELRKQVMREFDFRREAAIMKAVGDLVSAEFPIVFTPTVVNHLVTRNAMAMEFVDGVPLLKVLMTSPANTQRQILTTIAEVLGRGILVHGLFHSDPHPGNFFVTREMPYRICMLDFGQSKFLPDASRRDFATIVAELVSGTEESVARAMRDAGFSTKSNSSNALHFVAKMAFDSLPIENALKRWEEFSTKDPLGNVPNDMVMIFRVGIILRGLVSVTGLTDLSIAQIWSSYLDECNDPATHSITLPNYKQ